MPTPEDKAKAEAINPKLHQDQTPPAVLFFGANDTLKKTNSYLAEAEPLGLRAEPGLPRTGRRVFEPAHPRRR